MYSDGHILLVGIWLGGLVLIMVVSYFRRRK